VTLISAGAAKGAVEALAPILRRDAHAEIAATFGAVGAMKAELDSGAACDVIVLTAELIDALATENRILSDTIAPLGAVGTGIAVRDGDRLPDVHDETSLRMTLQGAGAIYLPERATAGVHFVNVLRKLGVERELAARLRPFPNGATAMRALADSGQPGDVGCTQITEIRYTPGIGLVAPLPPGFDLTTIYSAAVMRSAADLEVARKFVTLLTGPRSEAIRVAGGFNM
jgi:molybdate transport system substrate-binding protein